MPTTCIAIVMTGERAGERCTHRAKEGSDKCGTHRRWVAPPPRCIAVTNAGTQCVHNGLSAAVPTCGVHRTTTRTVNTVEVAIAPPACSKALCWRGVTVANEHNECAYHQARRAHRARHQERVELFREIYVVYVANRAAPLPEGVERRDDRQTINQEIRRVAMRVYAHLTREAGGVHHTLETIRAVVAIYPARPDAVVIAEDRERHALWDRLFHAGGAPMQHPPNTLAGIAMSRQSIHAPEVVQQSARGMDFLLKVKIPSGWDDESKVLDELKALWPERPALHADIRTWWNQPSCFTRDDNMYRKLLTGLWTYVKSQEDAERRAELEKRTLQECTEAIGMCCQGHTNRLVNVLSGFVPGVEVVVEQPKGEILQQKFAMIGGIEDAEERVRQGNAVIAELGLTAEEAAPWMEAIAA